MTLIQEALAIRPDPRYLARIAIFYGVYQKQILIDYSINMSTGGVFIESRMILPENTELTVKFKLPDSDTIIVTNARVAWTNGPGALKKTALPLGMGLQFLGLASKDRRAIRTYLDKGAFVPTW